MGRFHNPNYTGENRCPPCTAINVALSGVLAAAVATVSVGTGAILLALALACVYYRGYLVPGTPTLTQRYLPDRVLELFGKTTDGTEDALAAQPEWTSDVDAFLTSAGVLVPCEDADADASDALCLAEDVRTTWREEMHRVREGDLGRGRFAAELGVDVERLSTHEESDRFALSLDDSQIARWNSRAAYVADIAAGLALESRDAGWQDLDEDVRSRTLALLRTYLRECPVCETELRVIEDSTELCCGTVEQVGLECEPCEAVVFSSSHR